MILAAKGYMDAVSKWKMDISFSVPAEELKFHLTSVFRLYRSYMSNNVSSRVVKSMQLESEQYSYQISDFHLEM